MKKILYALLVFCLPISVYAYVITSDFKIDNQTDKNLIVSVNLPDSINPVTKEIAAKQSDIVKVEFKNSGLLYQSRAYPFSIKDSETGIEQVNGRIAFYLGASVWNKYSFLDSVAYSSSLQVKQT